MDLKKFFIDGKWVDPINPEYIEIINPSNEQSVGKLYVGSSNDVDSSCST